MLLCLCLFCLCLYVWALYAIVSTCLCVFARWRRWLDGCKDFSNRWESRRYSRDGVVAGEDARPFEGHHMQYNMCTFRRKKKIYISIITTTCYYKTIPPPPPDRDFCERRKILKLYRRTYHYTYTYIYIYTFYSYPYQKLHDTHYIILCNIMKNSVFVVERVAASALPAHISNWNPSKAAVKHGSILIPSSVLSCHHRVPPADPRPFSGIPPDRRTTPGHRGGDRPPPAVRLHGRFGGRWPRQTISIHGGPCCRRRRRHDLPNTHTRFWTYNIAPSLLNLPHSQPLQPDEKHRRHRRRRYRRKSRESVRERDPSIPPLRVTTFTAVTVALPFATRLVRWQWDHTL